MGRISSGFDAAYFHVESVGGWIRRAMIEAGLDINDLKYRFIKMVKNKMAYSNLKNPKGFLIYCRFC